jgi:hypothetical protein
VWFRSRANAFVMPASPGGSVVDPSLLRQANDRGVTIAFADLDGADGLWVPEERTVLVSRTLTEAEVARVIEHELTHVMIDDQHADLDAGRDVLVGHPPRRDRRWAAAALTAAALAAVLGGVTYGLAKATGGPPKEQVAPTVPGLSASESAPPGTVVVPSRAPDGRIVYVTVAAPAPSAPSPSPTPTPISSVSPSPSATGVVKGKPSATVPPGGGGVTAVPTTPAAVTTNPPATTDPPTAPPTTPAVPPTSPAGASAPGAGNSGGSPGGTVGQPGAAGVSDVLVAGSGDVTPVVDPTG